MTWAKSSQRRKQWATRTTSQFASGKHARAICDRSGFEYPYSEMVVEPGTNYLVHWSESDGSWNLVDHPQNFPPRKMGDAIGLENPRVETAIFEDFLQASSATSPSSILSTSGNYRNIRRTSTISQRCLRG